MAFTDITSSPLQMTMPLSQLFLYVTVDALCSRLTDTVDGHVIRLDPTEGYGLEASK